MDISRCNVSTNSHKRKTSTEVVLTPSKRRHHNDVKLDEISKFQRTDLRLDVDVSWRDNEQRVAGNEQRATSNEQRATKQRDPTRGGVTMTGRGATGAVGGGNLMLAAVLALLSYAPFEYVAKISLVVNMILFIVDPFPPNSRLLALVSTLVVAGLSAAHKHWQELEQHRLKEEQEIFEKAKEGHGVKMTSNNEDAPSNVDSGNKKSQ